MFNTLSYIAYNSKFFWLFLFLTLIMIVLAIKIKNMKAKVIVANLVAIPLTLCIAEGFCLGLNTLKAKDMEYITFIPSKNYFHNRYLNYSPIPNTKIHVISKFHGKKVFDVYYTINKDAIRETATSNSQSHQCLLFFGCSFMFGSGINDNETLPYLVGAKTNHKYKIYNLAYPGYGPHHMLSSIEHGIADKTIKGCTNSIVIYDGMPDHLNRIAGRKYWSAHDPKYSLVGNYAVYQGYFCKPQSKVIQYLKDTFRYTQTYIALNRLISEYRDNLNKKEKEEYEKLYIAILKKSKDLSEKKYHASRFIILFWNFYGSDDFEQAFKENSLESYMLINELTPGQDYFVKYDGHPDKLANEKIADFLIKKLNSTKTNN